MALGTEDPITFSRTYFISGFEGTLTLLSETGLSVVAPVATVAGAVHSSGRLGRIMEIDNAKVDLKNVSEETTAFVDPEIRFTDGTKLMEPAAVIAWSVINGPVEGVEDGNAKAAAVYEDTDAEIEGVVNGLSFAISLRVLESVPDNFGYYRGDSLPDLWQVQTFGPDNPMGHGTADVDSDGQNNSFEYTAGLDPRDHASRLRLDLAPDPGGGMRLVFHPRFTDRTYIVRSSTQLDPVNWIELNGGIVSDNGNERTIIDNDVLVGRKFYRVEIVRP